MRFRLTYDGQLKSAGNKSNRTAEKWEIRKALQPQLINLRETHAAFQGFDFRATRPLGDARHGRAIPVEKDFDRVVFLATSIHMGGKGFIPLVRRSLHLACKLHVTFLQKMEPGSLVSEGGDIDNRIKTLLDGLSMPNENDLAAAGELPDRPFHCLLESDALITGLSVDTDRLLSRPRAEPSVVHLLIEVTVQVTQVTDLNIAFIGD